MMKQIAENNITYFVDPDGDDNNHGLSADEPKKTIQKGIDGLIKYDMHTFQGKVKLADGNYEEQAILHHYSGAWPLTLEGNPENPGNVHLYRSDKPTIQGYHDRYWILNGLKLSNSGGFPAIHADHCIAQLRNILFGDCPNAAMIYVVDRGWVYFMDDIDVNGDANQFLYLDNQSYANTGSVNVNFLNNPAFTEIVRVIGAQLDCENTNFTGSPTGYRFVVDFHGRIFTNNQGQNWIPGSIPGVVGSMCATYF